MSNDLIHDRGCGPQIVGRRITVLNLVPYFLDPETSEALICKIYDLNPEQVAAARAYAMNHFNEVMVEHRRIEARNAAGNPPEVIEQMKRTHETFEEYRRQYNERKRSEGHVQDAGETLPGNGVPGLTFREWIVSRDTPHAGA